MNPSAVRTRQSGFELTDQLIAAYIGVIRFITRATLSPEEVDALRAHIVALFTEAPLQTLVLLLHFAQLATTLAAKPEPAMVSQVRDDLHARLYMHFRGVGNPCLRIIDRYVEVVRFDAMNGVLLTRGDVDGLMRLSERWAADRSQPLARSAERDRDLAGQIATVFTVASRDEQRFLAGGELLDEHWSSATPATQAQVLATLGGVLGESIERVYRTPDEPPVSAQQLERKAQASTLLQMQHTAKLMEINQQMHESFMSTFWN